MTNINWKHFGSSIFLLIGAFLLYSEYTMTERTIQRLDASELQPAAQIIFDSYLPLFLGALGTALIAAAAPIAFARRPEHAGSLIVGISVTFPVSVLACWSWTGILLMFVANANSTLQLHYIGGAGTVFLAGWFINWAMRGPTDRQAVTNWYASLSTDSQVVAQYFATRARIIGASTLSVFLAFLITGGAILFCYWRPPSPESLAWILLPIRLGGVLFAFGIAYFFVSLASPEGYRALVGKNLPR